MVLYRSLWYRRKLLARLTAQAGRGRASQGVGPHDNTLGSAVAVHRVGRTVGGEGGLATHYRLQVKM